MESSGTGRFVRLDDLESALQKDNASLESLQAQMRALEGTLAQICTALKIEPAPVKDVTAWDDEHYAI